MSDTRPDDVRLVPMTREERDWLADLWIEYLGNPNPCPLVAAWDKAPADAMEAILESRRAVYPDGIAEIKGDLCALGMPDASPTETEPHEH